MIKLLGDESVGADGKLILGGVGEEKKKKKETCCNIYIMCFNYAKGGPNWLKYLPLEDKSAPRLYER